MITIGCYVMVRETYEQGVVIIKEPTHPEVKVWGVFIEETNKVEYFSDNDLKESNAKQITDYSKGAN